MLQLIQYAQPVCNQIWQPALSVKRELPLFLYLTRYTINFLTIDQLGSGYHLQYKQVMDKYIIIGQDILIVQLQKLNFCFLEHDQHLYKVAVIYLLHLYQWKQGRMLG